MEEEIPKHTKTTYDSLISLVKSSNEGNNDDLLKVIEYFREDIEQYARFMRMPMDEAVQILILELIELVRQEEVSGDETSKK